MFISIFEMENLTSLSTVKNGVLLTPEAGNETTIVCSFHIPHQMYGIFLHFHFVIH